MSSPTARDAPQGYKDFLPAWNKLATSLQRTYVALGITATLSSLAVATFTAELKPIGVKIVSFLLAVALGLITAFDVGGKANSCRSAWRILKAAILSYENNPDFTIQELHQQYLTGEALIGDIKYSAPSKPESPPKLTV
jgi:hypothetical protein